MLAYSSYRSEHGRPKTVRGRLSSFRVPDPHQLRAPQHLTNWEAEMFENKIANRYIGAAGASAHRTASASPFAGSPKPPSRSASRFAGPRRAPFTHRCFASAKRAQHVERCPRALVLSAPPAAPHAARQCVTGVPLRLERISSPRRARNRTPSPRAPHGLGHSIDHARQDRGVEEGRRGTQRD